MKAEKVFLSLFGLLPLLIGLIMTPAYFLAIKKYPFISSYSLFFMVVATSLLVTGFSVLSLRHLSRKRILGFWIWENSAIIIVLMFALIVVMPILDQVKSFVPFSEQIKIHVKPGSRLYAYAPDETLRGFVPFYTGFYLQETNNKEYIEDIARKEKPIFIVIRDNRGKLEDELMSVGQFSIIARQGGKTERSLVLMTNKNEIEVP